MDQFTCISCRVAFKDNELQRLHYKTDWHRYNLKRKVAELPPVTAEEFQRRVILKRDENNSVLQDKSVFCNPCRKSFTNPNAYENHLNSKKHKENVKSSEENCMENINNIEQPTGASIVQGSGDCKVLSNTNEKKSKICNEMDVDKDNETSSDSEVEEVDSDEWDDYIENPIENNNCLFCLHHSRSLLKNIDHMTVAHTFFIPDIEYCIDIKGLLCYLGEKVDCGFMCLWCNDKGRTFHSADAARNHMLDKGHCKMLHEGLALAEYAPYYDYSKSYPDHEDGVDVNAEIDLPELDGSEYQLMLPSGVTIGHRSLMRYYKQSIDPNRAVVVCRNNKKLHKVLASYRALGWTATQQEAAARTARDLHHMKRLQAKYNTKLGVRNNKLQTHFRAQVNF